MVDRLAMSIPLNQAYNGRIDDRAMAILELWLIAGDVSTPAMEHPR